MKIRMSEIPVNSSLSKYFPVNYHDTFLCTVNSPEDISPDDIMAAFWTTMPRWLEMLFKIRNFIVKPFGLKTNVGSLEQLGDAIINGESHGLMSVVEKNDNETIISLDDKHLKAFISVYIEEEDAKNIYFTTLVKFHNKLGFAYFYIICPFHILVVKNIIKVSLKKLLYRCSPETGSTHHHK